MSGFRPRFFIDGSFSATSSNAVSREGTEVLDEGAELDLSSRDSHHALRVLRLRVGDPCEVVVGAAVYAARVSSVRQSVKVVLGARLEGEEAGAVYRTRVGLVQALTRPALMDQLLEKGTEVGASFFLVVPAAGSTRMPEAALVSRLDRWRRIVLEAAKQSKQSVAPVVDLVGSAVEARTWVEGEGAHSVVLEPTAPVSLGEVLERLPVVREGEIETPGGMAASVGGVALWSGPESGWTDKELEWFALAGMESARLGQGILRAETAGPVAVAVARLVTGDW